MRVPRYYMNCNAKSLKSISSSPFFEYPITIYCRNAAYILHKVDLFHLMLHHGVRLHLILKAYLGQ
jgi:hypothetical protein